MREAMERWWAEGGYASGEGASTKTAAAAALVGDWGALVATSGFLLWKVGAKTLVVAAAGGSLVAVGQLALVGVILGLATHRVLQDQALRQAEVEAAALKAKAQAAHAEAARLAAVERERLVEEARASDEFWGGWGDGL